MHSPTFLSIGHIITIDSHYVRFYSNELQKNGKKP